MSATRVQVFQFIQFITSFSSPEPALVSRKRVLSCRVSVNSWSCAKRGDLIDDDELARELEQVDQPPHLLVVPWTVNVMVTVSAAVRDLGSFACSRA